MAHQSNVAKPMNRGFDCSIDASWDSSTQDCFTSGMLTPRASTASPVNMRNPHDRIAGVEARSDPHKASTDGEGQAKQKTSSFSNEQLRDEYAALQLRHAELLSAFKGLHEAYQAKCSQTMELEKSIAALQRDVCYLTSLNQWLPIIQQSSQTAGQTSLGAMAASQPLIPSGMPGLPAVQIGNESSVFESYASSVDDSVMSLPHSIMGQPIDAVPLQRKPSAPRIDRQLSNAEYLRDDLTIMQ